MLEVSWSRAHTLASQAREHLEKALDALLIARTGRQSCPELGALLAGWDGKLTVQTGKVAARHIETCEICAGSRHGSLRPEVLARLLPLPALPPGLREPVLERAARSASRTAKAPLVSETVVDLIPGPVRDRLAALGSGRLRGVFSWDRLRANPGAMTAVAAVTLWVVAAMSATLITVTSLHGTRALADQSSTTATPPDTPAASSCGRLSASPSRLPSPSASTTGAPARAPTFAYTPTASPSTSATPSTSASATSSASASASAVADRTARPRGRRRRDPDAYTLAAAHSDADTDADAHADRHADAHHQLNTGRNWPTFRPYAGVSTTVWGWTTGRSSRPSRQATQLAWPTPMTNTLGPCTVTATGCWTILTTPRTRSRTRSSSPPPGSATWATRASCGPGSTRWPATNASCGWTGPNPAWRGAEDLDDPYPDTRAARIKPSCASSSAPPSAG